MTITRRIRTSLVVAVAVAGLGVGGVATAVATHRRDRPIPLVLRAAPAGNQLASREAMPAIAPADDRYAYWAPTYEVAGRLAEPARRAPALRLRAGDGRAETLRLARALGLSGTVERDEQGWVLRGGRLGLYVSDFPGLAWSLVPDCGDIEDQDSDAALGACDLGPKQVAPSEETTSLASPLCVVSDGVVSDQPADQPCGPVPEPVRPAGIPSRGEAERIARRYFAALGIATEGLRSDDVFSAWSVQVPLRVGDLEVNGFTSHLAVGPGGRLVSGNGWAASPERLGDYPLIGVTKALDRLRSGQYGGPIPLGGPEAISRRDVTAYDPVARDGAGPEVAVSPEQALAEREVVAERERLLAEAEAAKLAAGKAEPDSSACVDCVPEPTPPTLRITGVHLELATFHDLLVPAYVFELDDGSTTAPVVGVSDDLVDWDRSGPDTPVPLAADGMVR